MAEIEASWQPIDTAPKDGTSVLLICSGPFVTAADAVVGRFDAELGWIENQDDELCDVTHWMPLPDPPQGK